MKENRIFSKIYKACLTTPGKTAKIKVSYLFGNPFCGTSPFSVSSPVVDGIWIGWKKGDKASRPAHLLTRAAVRVFLLRKTPHLGSIAPGLHLPCRAGIQIGRLRPPG